MAESDDREFDAVLKDHADVRAAYRAASVDAQPPESLDAAILAASRRAMNAGPWSVERSRRFVRRVAVPLSAAAVMVLATSLSFLVYEEHGTPSAPERSRAVPAPAPDVATASDARQATDAPAAPAAAPAGLPRPEARSELPAGTEVPVAPSARSTESARPAPAAQTAPSPPRALPPSEGVASEVGAAAPAAPMHRATEEREALAARYAQSASERSAARSEVQESLAQAESVQASPSGPVADREPDARHDVAAELPPRKSMPSEGPATSAKRLASSNRELSIAGAAPEDVRSKAPLSPDDTPTVWVDRVRALMNAGRLDAARAEVARLRCRHPGVTLPADLPPPKAGVECPVPAAKEGSSDLR